MVDYSAQNVSQLKELLKARGLSIDGKKADLVSRLQQLETSDSTTGEASSGNVAEKPTSKTESASPVDAKDSDDLLPVEGANESTLNEKNDLPTEGAKDASKVESKEESKEESKAEGTQESEPSSEAGSEEAAPVKVFTPEERKQKAVEHFETKIRRAIKFGDEAGAAEAKRVLARVEKFGVELGTALAVELGIEKAKPENGDAAKRPSGRRNNSHKNKRAKRN